jgi:hypothetical protein
MVMGGRGGGNGKGSPTDQRPREYEMQSGLSGTLDRSSPRTPIPVPIAVTPPLGPGIVDSATTLALA